MSNTLKMIGTAEIPEPLEMGFDYTIAGKVSIPSIEKRDNEDGTFEYCHKGKMQLVLVVNKEGKTFKGTAKGSKSQKLRWRIMELGDDDYYERVMSKLIENLDEVLKVLKI